MQASFGIELDREAEVPVGVQLAWAVRARILAGELRAGERLPGVRELATVTGVNTNTVRAVYARLEAEGLIHAQHGRGTFVSEGVPTDDLLAAVTRRALADAREAGIDPRAVAAAMYGGAAPALAAAPSEGADPAARRRKLREEIAVLERRLADARLAAPVAAWHDEPQAGTPSPGGRLLSEQELRAQRDELAAQLALLEDLPAPRPAPAPAPEARSTSSLSATRPGRPVRWTISFGT